MPMPALVSSMPMPSYVSHKLLYPPPPHSPVGIAAHFSPHYNFFLLLNSALELVAVDLFWKRKIITGGGNPCTLAWDFFYLWFRHQKSMSCPPILNLNSSRKKYYFPEGFTFEAHSMYSQNSWAQFLVQWDQQKTLLGLDYYIHTPNLKVVSL